jgi:hypothetical protein
MFRPDPFGEKPDGDIAPPPGGLVGRVGGAALA